MRRVTIAELLDRSRQRLLAECEPLPFSDKWHPALPARLPPPSADTIANFSASLLPPGDAYADLTTVLPAADKAELLRLADDAVAGRFHLLGLGPLSFGDPVDWLLEPQSGKRTPLMPWKRLDSLDTSLTGDRKVVWELNRHQHLPMLACAYRLTRDERYADAVARHLTGWMAHNPPGRGINWSSSLELAFRSISWLWALALLRGWHRWTSLPLVEIRRLLYAHGAHIATYLSTYSSPNTHLTGEALGLYYLGSCLPDLPTAKAWRALGRKILFRQIGLQVHADGLHFEQSTWYHRYTADIYLHLLLLGRRLGDDIPREIVERTAALIDGLVWLQRPDGSFPLIGDDDGGCLIRFGPGAPDDWGGTLSTAACLLLRGEYKFASKRLHPESYWLLGDEGRAAYLSIVSAAPSATARAFPAGGVFVARRDWSTSANSMVVDCGPHGYGNAGHSHADALAVELVAHGQPMLIDAGTFTYTSDPAARDLFRSTEVHNAVTVDGRSSSEPLAPFKWRRQAKAALHLWDVDGRFVSFRGSHDGFARLPDPVSCERLVLFVDGEYWVVQDAVAGSMSHVAAAHYHFAPDVPVQALAASGMLLAETRASRLLVAYPDQGGEWTLAEGWTSPCYGAKLATCHATYSWGGRGRQQATAILIPFAVGQPVPSVRKRRNGDGECIEVRIDDRRDFVLSAGRFPIENVVVNSDFQTTWLRFDPVQSRISRIKCFSGSSFDVDGLQIRTTRETGMVDIGIEGQSVTVRVEEPEATDAVAPHGLRLSVAPLERSVSTCQTAQAHSRRAGPHAPR